MLNMIIMYLGRIKVDDQWTGVSTSLGRQF
jgi:hypothetical protein